VSPPRLRLSQFGTSAPWRRLSIVIVVVLLAETALIGWGLTRQTSESESGNGSWVGAVLFFSWPALILALAVIAEVAGWRKFRGRTGARLD
jgi:hypothetical protein